MPPVLPQGHGPFPANRGPGASGNKIIYFYLPGWLPLFGKKGKKITATNQNFEHNWIFLKRSHPPPPSFAALSHQRGEEIAFCIILAATPRERCWVLDKRAGKGLLSSPRPRGRRSYFIRGFNKWLGRKKMAWKKLSGALAALWNMSPSGREELLPCWAVLGLLGALGPF